MKHNNLDNKTVSDRGRRQNGLIIATNKNKQPVNSLVAAPCYLKELLFVLSYHFHLRFWMDKVTVSQADRNGTIVPNTKLYNRPLITENDAGKWESDQQ